ncbi:PPC domain-containing DNA-binding protein [Dyadobacter sp. 676]|uniref:PPC domain-containing DNA-binding protein n=1 Tax=Dyadobacter sp. 676 TaxID=3088362 RepID=A0AAU8FR10_9BACT
MHNFAFFLFTALSLAAVTAHAGSQNHPRYTKIPVGYLMVLRQGDDVFAEIEKMAVEQKIPSATLAGMGFVNARFGFFNFETKEYEPKEFEGVELASMTGSIAWQDGKPSLHCHGVATGKDFRAYGGHLLGATVSTGSLEITVIVHEKPLKRVTEHPLGANVLQLKD